MRKVYNFSPGPALIPEDVLLQAQAELLDWRGTGMSIMEISHRSPSFLSVAEQTESDLRDLLNIPKHYHVLLLPGGATAQFAFIPMNLLGSDARADYVDTGTWSKKALHEAKRYGDIHIAGGLVEDNGKIRIQPTSQWSCRSDAAYLHYTPNETIEGIEFHDVPVSVAPLVSDMSSNILSKPIDVNAFGLIYASAQKNLGMAGLTLVIIRDDLVKTPRPETPSMYRYQIQVKEQSMYNTPPTYAWYMMGLVLQWMKKEGGLSEFERRNQRKAKKLYACIDQHVGFYANPVHPDCRSIMNVPFDLINVSLLPTFLEEAAHAGLVNLKGHRVRGGVRASLYNAMPESGVDRLIEFMTDFARRYG